MRSEKGILKKGFKWLLVAMEEGAEKEQVQLLVNGT